MAPRPARAGTTADADLHARLEGIELAAAALLDAIAGSGLLDPTGLSLVQSFAAHHRTHAAIWAEGVDRQDGAVATPDRAVLDALAPAVLVAVDAPSMLAAALAVEQAMTTTVIDASSRFDGAGAAAVAARIGPVEARHRAVLAAVLGAAAATAAPAATGDPEGSLLGG